VAGPFDFSPAFAAFRNLGVLPELEAEFFRYQEPTSFAFGEPVGGGWQLFELLPDAMGCIYPEIPEDVFTKVQAVVGDRERELKLIWHRARPGEPMICTGKQLGLSRSDLVRFPADAFGRRKVFEAIFQWPFAAQARGNGVVLALLDGEPDPALPELDP
jgi:hypothetical protein